MKAKYTEAQILPPTDEDKNTIIWATVSYENELENGRVEDIKVNVLIEGSNIPVIQIKELAIKQANELLKKAISENQ
ncbi:MAG TPA: hypothetical protein VF692_06240 [Pyrinomonadaceae bacterium]|jgi:uncharacterized Zn ribbon protein